MQPDIDLQLQVVIKALTEVVGPAVPSDNKQASEQLDLSLAVLTSVRKLLPYRYRLVRSELKDVVAMGKELHAICVDNAVSQVLGGLVKQAEECLLDPENDAEKLLVMRSDLRACIRNLVEILRGGECYQEASRIIFDSAAREIMKARIWCFDSGFENELTLEMLD